MKRAILTSLLVISFTLMHGQGHDIIWEKCYGGTKLDRTYSGCNASDGGYIIAGNSYSSNGDVSGIHGDQDFWIIKLDTLGDLLWQKCLGGYDNEHLFNISNSNDGGYIAAGQSNSLSGGVVGNNGLTDMWIIKIDYLGNIEWQNSLGGSDFDAANYAIQTNDGGYICVGATDSNDGDVSENHGGRDCWIVKLSNEGLMEWQTSLGGSDDEFARSIVELSDGNFVFVAYTRSDDGDVVSNQGQEDVWVVKLDNLGNIIWDHTYGGSGMDYPKQIVPSTNGGFTICSETYSNDGDVTGGHGYFDIWLLELDKNGELLWGNCYGGTEADQPFSLLKTPSGGNIVAGITGSNDGDVVGYQGDYDCWVIETDEIGNLEWQQCYGGSRYDVSHWIFQNPNGNYVIPSWSKSIDGDVSGYHGKIDFWVFEIEGQAFEVPIIPIGSASIIITGFLLLGVFVIRRTGSV